MKILDRAYHRMEWERMEEEKKQSEVSQLKSLHFPKKKKKGMEKGGRDFPIAKTLQKKKYYQNYFFIFLFFYFFVCLFVLFCLFVFFK